MGMPRSSWVMGYSLSLVIRYPRAHVDDAERAVSHPHTHRPSDPSARTVRGPNWPLRPDSWWLVVSSARGGSRAGSCGRDAHPCHPSQSLAAPNSIVIGPSTRRPLGELFGYQDSVGFEVNGSRALMLRSKLTKFAGYVASRFEALRTTTTPLVRREEELQLLMPRWERANIFVASSP